MHILLKKLHVFSIVWTKPNYKLKNGIILFGHLNNLIMFHEKYFSIIWALKKLFDILIKLCDTILKLDY